LAEKMVAPPVTFKRVPRLVGGPSSTELTEPVKAGATTLAISSAVGFKVGEKIVIDKGTDKEEFNEIRGFGSIKLRHPLKHSHEASITISTLPETSSKNDGKAAEDDNQDDVADEDDY